MQPRWMVIVKGRAVGEFASRNAAFVLAERLGVSLLHTAKTCPNLKRLGW